MSRYCLHCDVMEVDPPRYWCDPCTLTLRAASDGARTMHAELATLRQSLDITTTHEAIATIVREQRALPVSTRRVYSTLREALFDQCTSAHPSGAHDPTHVHASEAGQCARAIWYRLQDVVPTNPPPLAARVAMKIGSLLHPVIVTSLAATYARVTLGIEHAWTHRNVSGHADLHYLDLRERPVVAEIKTMGPFAFRYLDAPKREHRLQALVNAYALDATLVHLVYVNTSAKRDESPLLEFVEPIDLAACERELDRLDAILETSTPPARDTGEHALNPFATGRDASWHCDYCVFRLHCQEDYRREHASYAPS